jgi:hypothetical protein
MGETSPEPDQPRIETSNLWEKIVTCYASAQQQGAVYQTNTFVRILKDERLGIPFVLRIAEALRDKPNSKKKR